MKESIFEGTKGECATLPCCLEGISPRSPWSVPSWRRTACWETQCRGSPGLTGGCAPWRDDGSKQALCPETAKSERDYADPSNWVGGCKEINICNQKCGTSRCWVFNRLMSCLSPGLSTAQSTVSKRKYLSSQSKWSVHFGPLEALVMGVSTTYSHKMLVKGSGTSCYHTGVSRELC